ncbi:hypothetical protein [uncultured Alsobacter sp.]|uniref:hypothetical protein n=1 Tax=uncultured Alsobacter sp. TaxID=1748258 RepID=UPI0025D65C47|nr:hypothetical protein [uncultured Alsobacter sp.]
MADLPILFSAPMVLALIDGRKKQTRRILKPQPVQPFSSIITHNGIWATADEDGDALDFLPVRYAVGDRLWVREAFAPVQGGVIYRADGERQPGACCGCMWRPSIHMPRLASRLTLTVSDVRVQRLQEISEADILDEGAPVDPSHRDTSQDGSNPVMCLSDRPWITQSPRAWFHRLWDSINGPDAWDANPWVAAYTFDPELRNIDA